MAAPGPLSRQRARPRFRSAPPVPPGARPAHTRSGPHGGPSKPRWEPQCTHGPHSGTACHPPAARDVKPQEISAEFFGAAPQGASCALGGLCLPDLAPAAAEGPEYRDRTGQSSQDTSQVLHEILGELRTIARGVNSLSLNSAVDRRRFTSTEGRADPNPGDGREEPNPVDDVDGRAYPNAEDGRADPNTAGVKTEPNTAGVKTEPNTAGVKTAPNAVEGRADTNTVSAEAFQTYCTEGIVAVLGSMLLGMVLCCVFHVWRKRRNRRAASRAGWDSLAEASKIFTGAYK
ncbi:uncharacterized protein [Pithys albifrons albifrons]|uniref:uncharacterized protein n=1 Tax=Pithys albifrons albifrons TaxID=3385563 RepID=UPI003A5D03C2